MNNKNYVFASFNIYGNKMYNIRHEIAEYLKTHFIDCLILTEAYQDNNDNLSLFKEFNINSSFHPENNTAVSAPFSCRGYSCRGHRLAV